MPSVSNIAPATNPDLLDGVKAISAASGFSERQVFYMLEKGHLPGKKLGRRWISSRTAICDALAVPSLKKAG